MATLTVYGNKIPLETTTSSDPDALYLSWYDRTYVQPPLLPRITGHGLEYSPGGTYPILGLNNVIATVADLSTLLGESNTTYTQDFGAPGTIRRQTVSLNPSFTMPPGVTGGLRYITTKEVQGFRLTISLPGLYQVHQTAGYLSTTLSLSAFYRKYDPQNSDAPWTISERNFIISDKTRSEILKWWEEGTETQPLPLGRYEILLVRNTEDHSGNFDYVDTAYLKEVTEIVYKKMRYPHTALLGLKIRATDQLYGQLPTITSLVKGLKVSVPDNCVAIVDGKAQYSRDYANNKVNPTSWQGGLHATKVWTDNPVWCLYDLLTNSRYGMADYYKIAEEKRGLMLANFYLMAKYCDELITYLDDSTQQDKQRPRFTLNLVIDQSKSAAEWIGTIAAVMRASVYYNEGVFWIDIDRPKYTSQIFTMSSIRDYTQSGLSYRNIPNVYEVQWINPDIGYEVDVFRLEDEVVQLNQHVEERKKALLLIGVTNFDQAKALAKFALLAGKYRTKLITFKTGSQGLRSMVGEVIGIQHDVPKWGWGGKVSTTPPKEWTDQSGSFWTDIAGAYWITGITERGDTFNLALSQAIDAPDGTPLRMMLQYLPSEDRSETLPLEPTVTGVTTIDGVTTITIAKTCVTQAGETITLDPRVGDTYILNLASNAIRLFKISGIKRDADEMVEITAVEYDPQIYTLADDTRDLGAWAVRQYSLLENPVRSSVTGVYITKKVYQDSSGGWKVGVEVYYEFPRRPDGNADPHAPGDRPAFWSGAQLHYAVNGATSFTSLPEINTTGRFYLPDVTETGTYQFVVTSVYASGKQTIEDALGDSEAHPYASEFIDLYVPNDNFLTGVVGLAIENRANDGTFQGRDCIVTWRAPLALDAALADTTAPAGSATTDQWLRHYRVEVRGTDGTLRRTSTVTEPRFVYTYEMNHQDAELNREFTVSVTAVDKAGRVSEAKTLVCKNPAPPALD